MLQLSRSTARRPARAIDGALRQTLHRFSYPLHFYEGEAKGDRRKWSRETQRLRVKWAGEPPDVGEHVVVEPVDGGGLVLTPSFEPLGSLVRALKRPRRDVVRATVGEKPDTVDVEYFGPRTLR